MDGPSMAWLAATKAAIAMVAMGGGAHEKHAVGGWTAVIIAENQLGWAEGGTGDAGG